MPTDVLHVDLDRVARYILESKRTVVFTGAGVSTESGIPDFRSPGGIWSRFDPEDFTIQKFLRSAESRMKQWKFLVESGIIRNAQPNKAHYAITELETMGRLDCVITQNIDNLHQKSGTSYDKVFELHGNMSWAKCLFCHSRFPLDSVLESIRERDEIPVCENCHGLLKPDVVFFGEQLPQAVLEEAARRSQNCDLFIVVGSSLVVYPAAYMPQYAVENGARIVIINASPTPFDTEAHVVVMQRAGAVMEGIVQRVKSEIRK